MATGEVGIGAPIGQLEGQGPNDIHVRVGEHPAPFLQERGELVPMELVEVDRSESLTFHDINVVAGRHGCDAAATPGLPTHAQRGPKI